MREIRTSGLMSGEGKRVASAIPRLSSTLLPLIPENPCYNLLASRSSVQRRPGRDRVTLCRDRFRRLVAIGPANARGEALPPQVSNYGTKAESPRVSHPSLSLAEIESLGKTCFLRFDGAISDRHREP